MKEIKIDYSIVDGRDFWFCGSYIPAGVDPKQFLADKSKILLKELVAESFDQLYFDAERLLEVGPFMSQKDRSLNLVFNTELGNASFREHHWTSHCPAILDPDKEIYVFEPPMLDGVGYCSIVDRDDYLILFVLCDISYRFHIENIRKGGSLVHFSIKKANELQELMQRVFSSGGVDSAPESSDSFTKSSFF